MPAFERERAAGAGGRPGGTRLGRVARSIRRVWSDVRREGPGTALRDVQARLNKQDFMQFGLLLRIVPWRIRTLSEPRKAEPDGTASPIVLCVVRNGMPWLRTFLQHHRELGASRFVILDNGSDDDTRRYLAAQEDVLLLASDAPYRIYENTFKRYLADRYGRDRWCLFVDVDELLAYPGMERRSMAELAAFAQQQGFNAVVTQMLDLYPDRPIAEVPDGPDEDLRASHRCYETASVERQPYAMAPASVVPQEARMHVGGVRRRVFGTNQGLTKVSLFRQDGRLRSFHAWHHVSHAEMADFSVLLLHYPFNRDYRGKMLRTVNEAWQNALWRAEYEGCARGMSENEDLALPGPDTQRYRGPEPLLDEGFLFASPAYRAWAAGQD